MSDLKLRSVLLRNWAKFSEAHVQFPDYGLVVVTGSNTASDGKFRSVGAGKTAFGEVIGRALFGVQSRYIHLKESCRDGGGDLYAKVEAVYLGKPLVVEIGYKCSEMSPTGEALRFTYDGQQVERGRIAQTREDLCALIGVPTPLAEWTLFVDGARLQFDALSQDEAVQLVMSALRQPPWGNYAEKTKKALQEARRDLAREQGTLAAARSLVDKCADELYSAQAAYTEAVEIQRRVLEKAGIQIAEKQAQIQHRESEIGKKEARQNELRERMHRITEEKSVENKALEVASNDITDRLKAARKIRFDAGLKRDRARSDLAVVEKEYDTLLNVPETCPTCLRAWDAQPDTERIQEVFQRVSAAKAKVAEVEAAYTAADEQVTSLGDQAGEISRKLVALNVKNEIERMSAEFAQIDREKAQDASAVHRMQLEIERLRSDPHAQQVANAKALLDERQRVHAETAERIEASVRATADAEMTVNVIAYWNMAFGPSGIPNMVLREAIDPLNLEARRISSAMTGGTLGMQFDTSRTLVDGQSKPQLLVSLKNELGSSQLKHNSKGETGLANYIVADTLASVGRIAQRVGFRWYDEVLPNHDSVICQSLYAYMREIAHKHGVLIFVVSHDPSAANYADYFLHVEKKIVDKETVSVVTWK